MFTVLEMSNTSRPKAEPKYVTYDYFQQQLKSIDNASKQYTRNYINNTVSAIQSNVVNYSALSNQSKSLTDGVRTIDFDSITQSIQFRTNINQTTPPIKIHPITNTINNVSKINFTDTSTLTGITSDSTNTDPTKALSANILTDLNSRFEALESKTQNQTATANETTFTGNITADTFNGYKLGMNDRFYNIPAIPVINNDLVMEVGRYIDFHYNKSTNTDYKSRLSITKPGNLHFDHSFILDSGDFRARNLISDKGDLNNIIDRTVALETKNTEQDTRLTNIETKNTEQDSRLTNIETKNTEQDGRLDTLENSKLTVVHYSTNASINVVCLDGLDEYIYRPRFKVSIIFEDSEYYPTFTSENTLLASYLVKLKIINNNTLYSLRKNIYSREVDGKVEISGSNMIILDWVIQKGRIDINLTDDGSQPVIILGINDQNYYPNALIQYPVVDNYLVSKNLAHNNEERLTAATNKNNEQDTRLTNIETKNNEQDTRLDNVIKYGEKDINDKTLSLAINVEKEEGVFEYPVADEYKFQLNPISDDIYLKVNSNLNLYITLNWIIYNESGPLPGPTTEEIYISYDGTNVSISVVDFLRPTFDIETKTLTVPRSNNYHLFNYSYQPESLKNFYCYHGYIIPTPFSNNIIDLIYPVGSIYMSMNDINPNVLFGGTWTQIKDNRFLLCSSSSMQTGGSTTITTENLPSHTHTFNGNEITGSMNHVVRHYYNDNDKFEMGGCFSKSTLGGTLTWRGTDGNGGRIGVRFNATPTGTISSTGSGQGYWQPYITVLCWYRVA